MGVIHFRFLALIGTFSLSFSTFLINVSTVVTLYLLAKLVNVTSVLVVAMLNKSDVDGADRPSSWDC